jgi:hypothetical protein
VVYVAAVAVWLLRGFAALEYHEVAAALPGASSEFALIGATVAAVAVLGGLLPILRRRAGQ